MVICSPARWIGTRVPPLGTAFLVACASGGIPRTEWMWAATALSLGVFGLVVLGRASQDAFLNANHRVAPSLVQRNDKSRSFVLICASILTSVTLILLPLNMAEPRIHYRSVQHEIDASGELWFVLLLRGQPIQRAKMTLEKNALIEDLPETWATSSGAWTTTYMRTPSAQSSTSYWSGYELESSRADTPYFDPRGYVLVYKSIPPAGPGLNSSWMLSYVVGQDRVSRVGETRGIPFASDPDVDGSFDSKTIITRDGVFCYNVNTGEVVQAVSLAVKAFSVDVTKTDRNLYLYGADKLFIYRKVGNQSASSNGLELEASIDVGPDFIGIGSTELWYKNKDHFTALAWAEPSLANRSPYQVVQKRPGQDLKVFRPSIPDGMQGDEAGLPLIGIILVGFAAPALYFLLIFVVVAVVNFFEFPRDGLIGFVQGDELVTAIIAIAIQIILSCLVAHTAARHRGLSKNARMGWSIAGAFLGFGIGLAIMAIYQRCIREKCDHCQKLRHVDLDTCEHCENGWDPPPQEGIEIVDVKKRPAQLECASA